jgi:hypothetical protein
MNRRHFLKRTGTVTLVAALAALVQAVPAVATAATVPTINKLGPDALRGLLGDPEVAESVRFMMDVAEHQLPTEEVEQWVTKLRGWGFSLPAHLSEREVAAAAVVCVGLGRKSLAEFRTFHAETHPKAHVYFELKAMVQRDRAAAA